MIKPASNHEQGTALLSRAIELAKNGSPANFASWHETARMALRVTYGEGDKMLERFDAIKYRPGFYSSDTPRSVFENARRAGVQLAIALLNAAVDETRALVPPIVSVDLGLLHPWVAGVATSLWNGGHHRQAVEEASRQVEVQLRAKLGLDGKTGASLVTEAFSPRDPTASSPRLRFNEFPLGSESWTNAHEGAMSFGRGCMMRVRNLYTHGHEPTKQEALESLAALSLLARWIDEAVVSKSEHSS